MPTGDDLRTLMRLFPSGICVVSAEVDGRRVASTIGSLVSLSLEPPLVGISVGLELALHELLRTAGAFGVSILRGDQAPLAQHFARGVPPLFLWEDVAVKDGSATGVPLLADALAWIECRLWARYDAGDHSIFVGEVVATDEGDAGPSLVYRERGYHAV
jgi:flavin reductase (DIM6/NTAB) family NADH-FMN oxidoreductase RutF